MYLKGFTLNVWYLYYKKVLLFTDCSLLIYITKCIFNMYIAMYVSTSTSYLYKYVAVYSIWIRMEWSSDWCKNVFVHIEQLSYLINTENEPVDLASSCDWYLAALY